jgi:hypothetical protein
MSRLQRLGGESCTSYQRGRCTRTKSPEDSADSRCELLEARRRLGAQTLDRLERIKRLGHANDREVARRAVVQKNLDAMTRLTCPGFVPASERGPMCRHQHLVYCLLLLPDCSGRCEYFMVRRDQTASAGKGGP